MLGLNRTTHSRQDTRRQAVAPVSPNLERLVPDQRREVERTVKVREKCAAARWLPAQPLTEAGRIYRQQYEIFLSGEVLGKRAFELIG